MDPVWRDVRRVLATALGMAYAVQIMWFLILARPTTDRSVIVIFNGSGEYALEFVFTIAVLAYLVFALVAEVLD